MTTYHISQELTDGTNETLGSCVYTSKKTAFQIARYLARENSAPDVLAIYVDDVFGGTLLKVPARRVAQ